MIIEGTEQRSLEWYRMRMGCFTGSNIHKLMGKGRKKDDVFSQTGKTYIQQVVGERMFNSAFLDDDVVFQDYLDQVSVNSKAIQWGVEQEEGAKRQLKERYPQWEIVDVAQCTHPFVPHFAASPDAIIYDRKHVMSVEIKCPNISTHICYSSEIRDNDSLLAVKPEYYWQVMAELSCSQAEQAVFVSYCPWVNYPIHEVLIRRDDDAIAQLIERVELANMEAERIMREIESEE